MKLKKSLLSILACFIVAIPFLFSGCALNQYKNPWEVKKEEKGFYYYISGENGQVATWGNKADGVVILGNKNANEIIDELSIPQELGGYSVKQIGEYYQQFGEEAVRYGIDCTNINKILINHKCCISDYSFQNHNGELIINADVRTSAISHLSSKLVRFNFDLQLLTSYEEWSKLWEYDWTDKVKIEFSSVGGQQQTYAFIIQKNTYVISPQAPTKENYTFGGWFDENYENEWNFETDKATENITLYAKWTEN